MSTGGPGCIFFICVSLKLALIQMSLCLGDDEQLLARLDSSADFNTLVCHDAVGGRDYFGIRQIEFRLIGLSFGENTAAETGAHATRYYYFLPVLSSPRLH